MGCHNAANTGQCQSLQVFSPTTVNSVSPAETLVQWSQVRFMKGSRHWTNPFKNRLFWTIATHHVVSVSRIYKTNSKTEAIAESSHNSFLHLHATFVLVPYSWSIVDSLMNLKSNNSPVLNQGNNRQSQHSGGNPEYRKVNLNKENTSHVSLFLPCSEKISVIPARIIPIPTFETAAAFLKPAVAALLLRDRSPTCSYPGQCPFKIIKEELSSP